MDNARLGPAAILAGAAGYAALWLLEMPAGQPAGRFAGELSGAMAVFLFCCSLVLAALVPYGERWFGGLDRVAVWHRRVAEAGVLLLVPHLALVTSPPDPYATSFGHGLGDVALLGLLFLVVWALAPRLRGARWPGPVRALARTSYERWLGPHRLTGLFVAVAVVHGALVSPSMRHSPVLRAAFVAVGAIGVAAYLYRELLARYVVPTHEYTVGAVRRLESNVVELALDPVRAPLSFAPGQFVVLAFGGFAGWQRHPFSISSAPADHRLGVTVKASGDYTRRLVDAVRPGVPARVIGPFGEFDYRDGGERQIWVAGGIGVTPFISWIRSVNGELDRDVDFFYSVRTAQDGVYRDEVEAAAQRVPSLRAHVTSSDQDGQLTADAILSRAAPGDSPWVYMCGPPAMMRSLARGFRRRGVPAGRVRWEEFGAR
jgi:predicted ferric reductase